MNTPTPTLGNVIAVDNSWVAKVTEQALLAGRAGERATLQDTFEVGQDPFGVWVLSSRFGGQTLGG